MDTMKIKVGATEVELIADDRICLGIKAGKKFEPDTLALWGEVCAQPDVCVLDVGAYSGLFSIAAAKLGTRPIAIEPLPMMQKRLQQNADLNMVTFKLIKGAACNAAGEVRIGYNDKVPFTSGASLSRKSGGFEMVKAVRLDEIEVTNLTAIKIDVERHEMDVLRGGLHLIKEFLPLLIVETLTPEARIEVEELMSDWYCTREFIDNRNLILEPCK